MRNNWRCRSAPVGWMGLELVQGDDHLRLARSNAGDRDGDGGGAARRILQWQKFLLITTRIINRRSRARSVVFAAALVCLYALIMASSHRNPSLTDSCCGPDAGERRERSDNLVCSRTRSKEGIGVAKTPRFNGMMQKTALANWVDLDLINWHVMNRHKYQFAIDILSYENSHQMRLFLARVLGAKMLMTWKGPSWHDGPRTTTSYANSHSIQSRLYCKMVPTEMTVQ